jgi:hypothetical protein
MAIKKKMADKYASKKEVGKKSPVKQVKVVPKNLNERQIKRVDKISETNPARATKVADRISDRRNARGAETSVGKSPAKMMNGKSPAKMKKC